MRIELPLPSWESSQRAEDDAHTLTLVPGSAPEWSAWQWAAEPAPALQVRVEPTPPVTVTLTF